MKTFVLIVSKKFPKTHNRAGEETYFIDKIKKITKIHTIRSNYDFWDKRIKQIQAGEAILSIRYWSDKPYQSKQIEILKLDKESDIGIQKLCMKDNFIITSADIVQSISMFDNYFTISDIAKNDGLNKEDFQEWFKNYNIDEPLAIIHFTKFRY